MTSPSAPQQRHAPDAATRPKIGGILHCEIVPTVISTYCRGAGDAEGVRHQNMRHVLGTFPESVYRIGEPLPRQSRVAFEHWETQAGGYFALIGPFFDDMTLRKCGTPLQSINVLLVLAESELLEAMEVTRGMLTQFSAFGHSWRHHQGSEKQRGEPEREVYVTLYRQRLLATASWLQHALASAHQAGHCFVFGNGVCYEMLCGIKLPPGTEVYS